LSNILISITIRLLLLIIVKNKKTTKITRKKTEQKEMCHTPKKHP
jgi:hypothetical protein